MRKILNILFAFLCVIVVLPLQSCGNDKPEESNSPETETPGEPVDPDSKILVAYFSWGGTTERMAEMIAEQTGANLYEIEPVTPYPTAYTPCTEVALEERDSNARPAIKGKVENWNDYDVIFIGCPVWWHEAPMIIHTFAESYDFKNKTVIPFCTYASTYRDETLAKIVEITPDATHRQGLGLTSGQINETRIKTWLTEIKVVK